MSEGFLGRKIVVDLSLTYTDNATVPASNTFLAIGGTRNKPINITGTTSDASSSDSDGWIEKLLAEKSADGSIDGVMLTAEASNLDEIEDYFDATEQPFAWLQFTRPSETGAVNTKVYHVPVLITGFEITGAYNETTTYSLSYESTGPRIISYPAA